MGAAPPGQRGRGREHAGDGGPDERAHFQSFGAAVAEAVARADGRAHINTFIRTDGVAGAHEPRGLRARLPRPRELRAAPRHPGGDV